MHGNPTLGLRLRCFAVSAFWMVVATAAAPAQPVSFDDKAPPPTLVPFRAEPKLGQVGRVEGTVDAAGKRFYLDGLDVMSPLAIQVFAKDPAKPVEVSLHRYFWGSPNLEGRTDARGDWSYVGRVHDEVGIELKAERPAEFYVLAWQGPKVEYSFGDAVFRPAGTGSGGGTGSRPGLARVLLVLAGIAMVAAMLWALARRRRAANAIGILLVAWALPASAGDGSFEERLEAAEGSLERIVEVYNENFDRAKWEIRDGLNDVHDRIDANETLIHNLTRQTNINFERAKNEVRGLQHSLQELSLYTAEELGNLRSMIEALELLAEEDRAAIPDPTHGGVPSMVSSCYADPDCAVCFESAHARLNELLGYYAQLGAIYRFGSTYVTAMAEYGDAKSGWHQLEQAQWYSEKQKIMASQRRLREAYLNKLADYDGRLVRILDEYATCESTYGLDDWMTRYGNPFHQALTASYRIP